MENKDWVQEAIQYEATPKSLRVPQEKMKFIESLGIPISNYYYEISKKENKRKIVDIWLNEALNGGNEVLEKLRKNALEGKEKSIEMYCKFILELKEQMDITSGGDKIIPIYGNKSISKHNSDQKDIQPKEKDQGSIGGNSSQ